ncbi:hypothetical protein HMPREF1141_1673 [Clostridium sp. MSTE9]|nr:hypothetical protein HMPREF1141_1673 [Clostridium sp. MSTE9]
MNSGRNFLVPGYRNGTKTKSAPKVAALPCRRLQKHRKGE